MRGRGQSTIEAARSARPSRIMSRDREPSDLGRSNAAAFGSGAVIGTLGGLIGLGGAEFRLPLLISLFRFHGLEAVILNKAVSLIVVSTALPFRASAVPLMEVADHWTVIVNMLAGSVLGAWGGAEWATRLKSATLYRIIAALLVVTAGCCGPRTTRSLARLRSPATYS